MDLPLKDTDIDTFMAVLESSAVRVPSMVDVLLLVAIKSFDLATVHHRLGCGDVDLTSPETVRATQLTLAAAWRVMIGRAERDGGPVDFSILAALFAAGADTNLLLSPGTSSSIIIGVPSLLLYYNLFASLFSSLITVSLMHTLFSFFLTS